MAKIQIEYTANVENLKTKLNELVKINETLSRSVFATKMALEDMSKATSQSTTKKALEDIKKASDGVSKSAETAANSLKKAANTPPPKSNYKNWAKETESIIKQLFSNVLEYEKNADARRQKFANDDVNRRRKVAQETEKYDQETKRLWLAHLAEMDKAAEASQKRKLKLAEESVKAKQREVEAKKKADEAEYINWWKVQARRMAEEEKRNNESASRLRKAQAEHQKRLAQETAATEKAAAKQAAAYQKALEQKTRAAEKAAAQQTKAAQQAAAQQARAYQSLYNPLQQLTSYVSAAFAIGAIVNFTKELVNLLAQVEILQSRFQFIYSSETEGERGFLRVKESIRELGLDFMSTIEQFSSFSIAAQQANFTMVETEKMFISFASSLRAVGASNLQVQRSFYALQQMMSKGVVAAEELRRQMGESLPGAASLMFRAYKKLHPESVQTERDFMKLQEQGKILSREVLPEFIKMVEATFAPALESKKGSLVATIERAELAWIEFKQALLDTGPIKNALDAVTGYLRPITQVMTAKGISEEEKASYTNQRVLEIGFFAGIILGLKKAWPTIVGYMRQAGIILANSIKGALAGIAGTFGVAATALFLGGDSDQSSRMRTSPDDKYGTRVSQLSLEQRKKIYKDEIRRSIEAELTKKNAQMDAAEIQAEVNRRFNEMVQTGKFQKFPGQPEGTDTFTVEERGLMEYEAGVERARKSYEARGRRIDQFAKLSSEDRKKELDRLGDIVQGFVDEEQKITEIYGEKEASSIFEGIASRPVSKTKRTDYIRTEKEFRDFNKSLLADYVRANDALNQEDLKKEEEDKKALEARKKYLQGLVDLAKIAVEEEKQLLREKGKDELGIEQTNSDNLLKLQKDLAKAELNLQQLNDRDSAEKRIANEREYQLNLRKLGFEYTEYTKDKAKERTKAEIDESIASLDRQLIDTKEYEQEFLKLTLDRLNEEKELNDLSYKNKEINAQEYAKTVAQIDKKERDAKKSHYVALAQIEIAYIEKKIALVQQEFVDSEVMSKRELSLNEELMLTQMELDIKQNELHGELAESRRQKTLSEIKKMYSDARKEDEEYFRDLQDYIDEPFIGKVAMERRGIRQETQERLRRFDEQVASGRLGPEYFTANVQGIDPLTGDASNLGKVSLGTQVNMGAVNKTREDIKASGKKREQGLGMQNIFGLGDQDLENLKFALDTALSSLQSFYDLRVEMAKRASDYEADLLKKRLDAGLIRENEYNEELKKIQEKQARVERDAAIFKITLDTAQAVMNVWANVKGNPILGGVLTALVVGLGAAQMSAVNSAPLPTFHEGGLDIKSGDKKRPDNGLKQGEFYAKLLEGESVMTREQTAKYKDVLKAIREDSLPLQIMKGYTAPAYHRSMDEPYRMAKEQTSLELAFQNAELVDAIKRNGAVAIKNADELADAIVSKSSYTKITNRRRIR